MSIRLVKTEKAPRHPMVVAGALRECAERLQRLVPQSHTVERMSELCEELEQGLMLQQLQDSQLLIEARGASTADACFMAQFPNHGARCEGPLAYTLLSEESEVQGFSCSVHRSKLESLRAAGDTLVRYRTILPASEEIVIQETRPHLVEVSQAATNKAQPESGD